MATSATESIGSITKEAPRKRGPISKIVRSTAAVLAFTAAGATATAVASNEGAPPPRIESAAKPRPETSPKQQVEEQSTEVNPGGGSLPPEGIPVIAADQIQKIVDYVRAQEMEAVGNYIAAQIAQEEAERQATQAQQARQQAEVYSNSYPGDFLACVRQRESGGNYSIYNVEGSGAAGAYQFLPGTWNGIAESTGRMDLVGVDPAQASPADQDAMAQALYAQQGAAPWGGGC